MKAILSRTYLGRSLLLNTKTKFLLRKSIKMYGIVEHKTLNYVSGCLFVIVIMFSLYVIMLSIKVMRICLIVLETML